MTVDGVSTQHHPPSFRELLDDVGQDVAALLIDEVDLVTTEIRTEVRTSLLVLGVLSVLSAAAVLTLCAAAVLGLARILEPALAALAVGCGVAALAAAFAIAARHWRQRADRGPVEERAS
jgi:putative superfamily III holin-X